MDKNKLMEEMLEHSAKGHTWKKHKYIAKKNGRYIYPNKKSLTTSVKVGSDDFDFENSNDIHQKSAWKNVDPDSTLMRRSFNFDKNSDDTNVSNITENLFYDAYKTESYVRRGASGMPSNVANTINKIAWQKVDRVDELLLDKKGKGRAYVKKVIEEENQRYKNKRLRTQNGKITR